MQRKYSPWRTRCSPPPPPPAWCTMRAVSPCLCSRTARRSPISAWRRASTCSPCAPTTADGWPSPPSKAATRAPSPSMTPTTKRLSASASPPPLWWTPLSLPTAKPWPWSPWTRAAAAFTAACSSTRWISRSPAPRWSWGTLCAWTWTMSPAGSGCWERTPCSLPTKKAKRFRAIPSTVPT